MFHIYRKASTVLVWLGPAGPGTCLGADILNVYDTIWQDNRIYDCNDAVAATLKGRALYDNDTSIYVDEFLIDLRDHRPSDDERGGADTLGLLSMALDGIADILARAWIRRTWIVQEIAAATNVKFQCGRSVLSYDAFFHVIPDVGSALFHTRSTLLAGGEDLMLSERRNKGPRWNISVAEMFSPVYIGDDGPASFTESPRFTEFLHELRLLVNDPGRIKSRRTQTELLLVFLVETFSRGFDVSIAVDRVYSLMAVADTISSASWGLTNNIRTASSPQQLPVDYSVGLQAAVLRLLKIRMNEMRHFYVAIEWLSSLRVSKKDWVWAEEDRETKSILFSLCSGGSTPPSWLSFLEVDELHLYEYLLRCGSSQKDRKPFEQCWWWTEQDVTEPDTLVMRGKALGRLVVDSEEYPSRTWVALPCPLGQEFETCDKCQKPVRALSKGFPDERPAADDGASLDDKETRGEAEKSSDDYIPSFTEVKFWSWEFPPHARDGDVLVVFFDTCALLRPSHVGRYTVVGKGLRVPVDSSQELSHTAEKDFIQNHLEDLDTFVLI